MRNLQRRILPRTEMASHRATTWERSVYRWIGGYWQVPVKLSTKSEPVSALTLHAKIHEEDYSRQTIDSGHVP